MFKVLKGMPKNGLRILITWIHPFRSYIYLKLSMILTHYRNYRSKNIVLYGYIS